MKASPVSEVEKPKAFIHWVADPVEVEVSFAILHTRQVLFLLNRQLGIATDRYFGVKSKDLIIES